MNDRAMKAKMLLDDEVLLAAFAAVSQAAMTELVLVDPEDKTTLLRLQAKCRVIDDVLSELETFILAGQQSGIDVA